VCSGQASPLKLQARGVHRTQTETILHPTKLIVI